MRITIVVWFGGKLRILVDFEGGVLILIGFLEVDPEFLYRFWKHIVICDQTHVPALGFAPEVNSLHLFVP